MYSCGLKDRQDGSNVKECKRNGRAGPIVTLKCMEKAMANHVMGAVASKKHHFFAIDGVSIRQDLDGRFCLNDLHRAAGGEDRHSPNRWYRSGMAAELISVLTPDLAFAPVEVIRGGSNPGTFVCKELVYAYAMWISAAFNLKVIRTFDALQTAGAATFNTDRIQAGVILLESAAKMLNLSNSSKLGAYQKLQQVAGLPDLMPSYAIDAPAGAQDGSSRPTISLSALLKANNIRMTANQASGPASWRHNRLYNGVCDLSGNAWEVPYGVRFMYGEVQVLENAAVNSSLADYDNWKAIDVTTGALITPTYTGTIAGGNYVATTANSVRVGHNSLPSIFPYNNNFQDMGVTHGTISAAALNVLRQYGLFVTYSSLQKGEFSYGTGGINIPVRGGDYKMTATTGNNSPGLFALNGRVTRDTTFANLYAGRPCFYS